MLVISLNMYICRVLFIYFLKRMRNRVFLLLIMFSVCLTWCEKWWNVEQVETNEYPIAEQFCIEHDWELTADYDWVPICLFFADEWCSLEDIENWECDLFEYEWDTPPSVTCEENWWEAQVRQEWWEEQEVCWFKDDWSFCYLNDFADWSCKKWDMTYFD